MCMTDDNNEAIIGLVMAGSSDDAEAPADPTMIRYRTSIYPRDVGVELLIRDLEIFKSMIKNLEPRLIPHLQVLYKSVDYALAGKSSEDGFMIDLINTQKKIDHVTYRPDEHPEDSKNSFGGDSRDAKNKHYK